MPLNRAKLPSPCRKNRSIGIIRSMALSSGCGGGMLRDANSVRSGSRSIIISSSAPELRLICPPSGRICRCSSSRNRLVALRTCRCCPAMQSAAVSSAITTCRRGTPSRASPTACAQMTYLPGQAAQKAAIEAGVGLLRERAAA